MKNEVYINLDKPRKYILNLNAMVNFEKVTGERLMEIGKNDTMSMTQMRALIWCGLNENEKIDIRELGKMVDLSNIEEITSQVMKAYDISTPDADPDSSSQGKN